MSRATSKPIAGGMRSITPHLICTDAAKAIAFYKKAFGALERTRLPGPDGKLMHAMLRIGDSSIMLVDEMPQHGALGPNFLKGSPVTIHLYLNGVDATVARGSRGRKGHHAGREYVLGRPLWSIRGSLRPSLVGSSACACREP